LTILAGVGFDDEARSFERAEFIRFGMLETSTGLQLRGYCRPAKASG
jgi:hypothetical protein